MNIQNLTGFRHTPHSLRRHASRLAMLAVAGLALSGCRLEVAEGVDGARVTTPTYDVPVQVLPSRDELPVEQQGVAAIILDDLVQVTMNGEPVDIDANGAGVNTVEILTDRVFTPVEIESALRKGDSGELAFPFENDIERATLINLTTPGSYWAADGELTPHSGAFFLNQSAIDKMSAIFEDRIDLDFGSLFPVGDCVFDVPIIAKACISSINLDGYTLDALAIEQGYATLGVRTGSIVAVIDAYTFFGLLPVCTVQTTIDFTTFNGSYELEPSSSNPSQIDVNQTAMTFTPGPSRTRAIGGACSLPLIGSITNLVAGAIDIGAIFSNIGGEILGDPDASGPEDAVVAEEIETVLQTISISQAVGDTLNATMEGPIESVQANGDHIALRTALSLVSNEVEENSPDLDGSYAMTNGEAPYPGPTSPDGSAYDIALGISVSGFNQLLKSQTEAGLLTLDIDRDFVGNLLTLGALYEAGGLGPCPLFCDQIMLLKVRPQFAPVILPESGPNGELATLEIAALKVETFIAGTKLLDVVFDARVGMTLSTENGSFRVSMSEPDETTTNLTVTGNPNGLPVTLVETLFSQLTPVMFPLIANSVEAFPTPSLGGIEAHLDETARIGDHLYLFGTL